jgi:hypothetical protein
LEGVLVLHKVMHELRIRKQKGIIMKHDFKKAMIRLTRSS